MVDFKKMLEKNRKLGRRAVLIPTKGRPATLKRLFERQPFLNNQHTFVGVERKEWDRYHEIFDGPASRVRTVMYDNEQGITSFAREQLRQRALAYKGAYDFVLPLDDNMLYTEQSLNALVDCATFMGRPGPRNREGRPVIVSGEHPTAAHFQADRIAKGAVVGENKFRIFPHTTVIYWAIPAHLYWEFKYPDDCCFDDIYLALWLMTHGGVREFWVCRDAPFDKRRFQPGGQGDAAERAYKFGLGIARLAKDFPQWMTTSIVQTRIPYKKIQEALANGQTGFDKK